MTTIQSFCSKVRPWLGANKRALTALGLVLVLTFPRPARGQLLDPCCSLLAAGLASIQAALTNVVGRALNRILTVDTSIEQYQQTVVWPANLIAQAQSLVAALQGNLRQIQNLSRVPVGSATLAASQQLEQLLLSRNPNNIVQTSSAYAALYGALPAPTAASPQVLNRLDMADAMAQTAMKRAIEIDALADLELEAANQLNQSIESAAPGSAPIIEAQADAWLMRAHAYTQSATADLMRLRAIELADAGSDIKLGAANTTSLRQALANLLQHQ
jgi:hypothetical protein